MAKYIVIIDDSHSSFVFKNRFFENETIEKLSGRRLILFPETAKEIRPLRQNIYKVLPEDSTLEELQKYGEDGLRVLESFLFPLDKKTKHEMERRRPKPPQDS